jgi:hypothetical protein
MSWICVVGMKVVVDEEKKYGELVDVCIPRPRRTRRDSSIWISNYIVFRAHSLRVAPVYPRLMQR